MAGQQVNLPAVGPVSRRALLIGGGLAALVMGVLWWRKRSTPAAAAPTDAAPVDDSLSDGTAGGGGGGGGGGSTGSSSTSPTSNPQWRQAVMDVMGPDVADQSALSVALGLYLTGGAVTSDQELLIDQAIAAAGYPPVAGPNGYPPAIRTQPGGGQSASKYVAVAEGTWVSAFLAAHPDLGLTEEKLKTLNPGVIKMASEKGYDPNGTIAVINATQVRVA